MKIIDLLVKIANGEEVPEKIKYEELIYEFNKNKKGYYTGDGMLFSLFDEEDVWKMINKEIEIIEEPKKIEKLEGKLLVEKDGRILKCNPTIEDIQNKLNEIIDYINGDSNE